jgi:MFS family permease
MLELREGIVYVWRFKPIRVLIALLCLLSLVGMPALTVLMPIFGDHFGGAAHGAQTFGFLSAATGLGALCGALYLAAKRSVKGLSVVIAVAITAFGVTLIGFSQSPHLALAIAVVVLAGWGGYTSFATANTILQSLTDDEMRGRVMSFFSMAFSGMAPLGTLLAGFAAKRLSTGGADGLYVGATRTVLIAGAIVLGAAVLYIYKLPKLRALIRPVYRRKGILPEVADGLRAADILSENGEE